MDLTSGYMKKRVDPARFLGIATPVLNIVSPTKAIWSIPGLGVFIDVLFFLNLK